MHVRFCHFADEWALLFNRLNRGEKQTYARSSVRLVQGGRDRL